MTTSQHIVDPVVGSLCTGYGGLDLGVLAALGEGRIAWVADPDPHVRTILAARAPGVPNLGDISTVDWCRVEAVDVLTAGFPCQDISAAGKRAGIEKGARSGLWTSVMAGVRVLRPTLVVLENVAALRWRNGGLHRVLGDLAEAGYDAVWRSVRAADIGAAHRRERIFVLAWLRHRGNVRAADPDSDQLQRRQGGRGKAGTPWWILAIPRNPTIADSSSIRHRDGRSQSWAGFPSATVATGAPARGSRGAPADATSHGWNEGLSGAARLQGRPDVARDGHPADRRTCDHRVSRRLVAVESDVDGAASPPQVASTTVCWSEYEPAIRRWETALGRPTPHPTQPGAHGRPVLAPAFVEHLMGLPAGWVTDLPIPRTAQLRALGNGVVPAQAAYAVALLLDDLDALLETERAPVGGQEVAAA
ncbi:DNA cytosine methyltransferase [Saccharothrix saharensis]|uniref:DNA cytosine methyltransferase n=1 Tax=Saccharothrix saharensis TaxID=571190 RepID=UPI0036B1A028